MTIDKAYGLVKGLFEDGVSSYTDPYLYPFSGAQAEKASKEWYRAFDMICNREWIYAWQAVRDGVWNWDEFGEPRHIGGKDDDDHAVMVAMIYGHSSPSLLIKNRMGGSVIELPIKDYGNTWALTKEELKK